MLASNSLLPLEIDQGVDPRINLLNRRYYTILKSAQNNLQIPLPASGLSDTSLTFTNPFTPSNILDKRISCTVRFAYAATSSPAAALQLLNIGTYDAPRMFPVQSCITQLTSQVNTTSFTLPTNDVLTGISTIRTRPAFRDKMLSTTPVWPDQFQEYSLGALTNRNPLGAYGDNPAETLRGGWVQTTVTTNTTSAAAWSAQYNEIILLSPYESGMGDGPGFSGVTTNSWTMNLGDLTRSWSHMDALNTSGSPPWTTFTASIIGTGFTPTLNYNILVPHLIPPLPSDTFLPLTVVDRLTTSAPPLAAWSGAGGVVPSDFPNSVVTSNMVNLSFIPSMVLIYVRESNAQLTSANLGYTKSDSFMGISHANITFNTQSGILSNATQHQLYEFSVQSGLEMSWPQFYRHRGSVLAFQFGKDIPLINPDLAPGCRGNFNFQCQVSYYNPNQSRAVTAPVLYVLPFYEGTVISKPGVWVQQQGVISRENVLEVSEMPPVNAVTSDEILGGGPFDFIRTIIGKIAPIAEKVVPIVKALAPVVGPLIGLGLEERKHSAGSRDHRLGGGAIEGVHKTIPDMISDPEMGKRIKDEMKKSIKDIPKSGLSGRLSLKS